MLNLKDLQLDYTMDCESNFRQRFLLIKTMGDLGKLLKVHERELNHIATYPYNYKTIKIPKKKGGFRTIDIPNDQLKSIQKTLNLYFQTVFMSIKTEAAQGFIYNPKKRFASVDKKLEKRKIEFVASKTILHNIKTNAAKHSNQKFVLNIDLKDFFTNISIHQIYNLFQSPIFQFDSKVASMLALLTTYQKRLPQGAPTSPILSNFVCLELDKELERYCQEKKIIYTRYADDLTFSSNKVISDQIIYEIKYKIEAHQFQIQEKKLRLISQKGRQTVTGLVVNKKVNVDRAYYKKLRAILHDCSTNGIEKAFLKHQSIEKTRYCSIDSFLNSIAGKLAFVAQIKGKEDKNVIRMQMQLKSISSKLEF
jgi:RNA-directed DNA polymerase